MAKFDGKWPKMWPTCIFRHGEGSEGLKNGFAEPSHRGAEPSHRGAEPSHRGAEIFCVGFTYILNRHIEVRNRYIEVRNRYIEVRKAIWGVKSGQNQKILFAWFMTH